jgi:Domain of unknown function (DUF4129)
MKLLCLLPADFHRYYRERSETRVQRLRMKLRVFVVLIVLGASSRSSIAIPTQAPATSNPHTAEKVYDVRSFAAELQRLEAELQRKPSPAGIKSFRDGLPPSWNVSTPEHSYSISTQPLRDQLNGNSADNDNAETWLEHLQVEVQSTQRAEGQSLAAAHTHLDKILAGRGFEGVRPPTYLELLRERASAWLQRLLIKLFSGLSRHPIGAKVLFWVVLIAGVGFVALWIFRYISGRDSMNFFQPGSTTVTTRTWQEWIHAAREAAARGDFREAVHSAYWAGITRLEETGTLPRDRTKTPREYLRLIDTRPLETEVSDSVAQDYKKPLTALTSRLERIWYANRMARLEDFDDTLRQLEALGCSLE